MNVRDTLLSLLCIVGEYTILYVSLKLTRRPIGLGRPPYGRVGYNYVRLILVVRFKASSRRVNGQKEMAKLPTAFNGKCSVERRRRADGGEGLATVR